MRQESDFLGTKTNPPDAYWGVHTARAIENFPITGHTVAQMPELIRALALVKKAAAHANLQLGVVNATQAGAIAQACDDLLAGQLHDQFVVDVIQGGAGTSTNMNANEVIANRALEHLGLPKGSYDTLHPNDQVNASQSTNDAYPTALKLATWFGIQDLLAALAGLRGAFEAKAREFNAILKIGRTQLQDAVPMTLGQEFTAFASMVADDEKRLRESAYLMTEVNLGGTAIGTGINAPVGYVALVIPKLAELSGVPVTAAADMIAATCDTGAFVDISGILKRIASKLSKFSNDLRLLSSGPQAGVGDIKLPPRQAGSSIMPGKVNPVIPEATAMVAAQVIGNDAVITVAGQSGNFELNVMLPVIAQNLLSSIELMANSSRLLADKAIASFKVNEAKLKEALSRNPILVTALNPIIGYQKAAEIAKTAYQQGRPVIDVALEYTDLSRSQLEVLLDPEKLTAGGV